MERRDRFGCADSMILSSKVLYLAAQRPLALAKFGWVPRRWCSEKGEETVPPATLFHTQTRPHAHTPNTLAHSHTRFGCARSTHAYLSDITQGKQGHWHAPPLNRALLRTSRAYSGSFCFPHST